MTKEELIEMYLFCLKNGWVHNTPLESVLREFEHRNECFKSYFQNISKGIKEIHILIGEAPPYYPNDKFPEKKNRKYFYDEEQSHNTGYFKEPCKHFLKAEEWGIENPVKKDLLIELAKNGVIIFDIFPFPVFQSTDIRKKIIRRTISIFPQDTPNKQPAFEEYLNKYFTPRLICLKEKLQEKLKQPEQKDIPIKYYLFAPKLTSIQFLYWAIEKEEIKEKLVKFDKESFKFKGGWLNKSLKDFIQNIENGVEKKILEGLIKQYPIFMNGSGQPSFSNFFNGKKK
jgi:hypothetical protein